MSDASPDLTRRDFAKAAVAAVAVPVLAPLAACTASPPEAAPAPAPAAQPAPPTAPAAAQQPPDPVAQALGEAIRAQYGSRMTAQEMESVQRSIAGTLRTAQRLREFSLPIATEPSFVYRVPGGAS